MRGHMHMVTGSWTECAKYSIEGKKNRGEFKGRNRVRLDPKAREAVNAKYAQCNQNEIFVCRPTTTIRTRKKGFLFYVTGLKPICVDNGPSFLSRNAFCKWRLKWTHRRINFLRKPQCVWGNNFVE